MNKKSLRNNNPLRFFWRGLALVAVMMMASLSAVAQTTYQYYCLHVNNKGYMKQYKGIIGNENSFRYDNIHADNGSSIWVYSSDGYLQQEMYYLNVLNNQTLVLSTTPVTQWDLVDDGDKKRFQMHNSTKILGLDGNDKVVLSDSPTKKYAACTLTLTENNNKWDGPNGVSWTVQSPQLVTYLRVYYMRNITVVIDKNDAGSLGVKVVDKKDSRSHCSLTYDTSQSDPSGKGTKWDINTATGVIYNLTSSQQTATAAYTLVPFDPLVNHPDATTANVTIKITAKALSPNNTKKYLLFSTQDNNYRFPKESSSLSEGDLLPVNGKQNNLTESVNGDIAYDVETDSEGFYLFKNVTTGRYFYYDADDYSVSDYGAVKIGSTTPGADTRYKFRLYSGAGKREPFGNCLYIIPYDKQFAVWKSDGVLSELFFALYMNTQKSTKIASIYKASDNAKWKIYAYEWEYRLWDDYSIVGDESLYATGNYPYTASTWFSRNIKESPKNTDYCLLPGSKTHDGINYTWGLTELTSFISTSDVLASGVSTLTASVNSLPPGTRSGTLTVTANITTPVNKSNSKTLTVTLYNLNPTFEEISSLSEIDDSDGLYKLANNITYSSTNHPGVTTFRGTLDGGGFTINGLTEPLFTTISGGTVRNLNFSNVNIGSGTNVGAVCSEANGMARIYNVGVLGGSIGGSDFVGSLVGILDGSARVINCFSFANITGGSTKAGIVGKNNYASKSGDIKTMVMNCMFYGDIEYTSNTNIFPIYGGLTISNDNNNKLNNYNYYLYEASYSKNRKIPNENYNCALSAEERFLVQFEFYRNLLNSTRDIAAWYATGSTDDAHTKMLKWVLDKSIAPYPILKVQGTYPSVVNYDPVNTFDAGTGQMVARTSVTAQNKGKNLGTLTVNISIGSGYPTNAAIKPGKSTITLQRTDKDFDDYNFNYDKVQLPYYNEVGTMNCTGNKVVTGWKITGMTGGTQGTYTAADQWGGYNFADRSTYAKDLCSVSGRVFSQGAYFDVPTGVTAINIEPYWGKAAYLSDPKYDKYGYAAGDVDDFGERYANNTNYTINGSSQKVYTSIGDAVGALTGVSSPTVYDYAVVLVGNYHKGGDDELSGGSTPFSVMSIDLNEDNEPDYSLIYRSGKQKPFCPIRFDFINVPGMAMAHKTASDANMGIPGNTKMKGWFEITNTALIHYAQFEYDSENKNGSYPLILLGGVIEQFVSTNGQENTVNSTIYIHVGSNVWFKLFNNGCHMDKKTTKTPHIPISATGGQYDEFYLSGYFQPNAPYYTDDAECYIDGGYFGDVAGAGQEKIDGNVTWYVNHAYIENYYGGGINENKSISGNITDTIVNSYIGIYCGGPKFGNMEANKNVTTYAENTTFGTYYGAGNGGTAFVRQIWSPGSNGGHNQYQSVNYPWNDWLCDQTDGHEGYVRGKYVTDVGYAADYEAEHFEGSSTYTVARLYIHYASLSLAKTNGVLSKLESCTVEHNFYGGGKLGAVDGNAVSELNNCTVYGNVFGAGYSAAVPKVNVYPAVSKNGSTYTNCYDPEPKYNVNTGQFEKGVRPDPVEYTWSSAGSTSAPFTDNGDSHEIYTDKNLGDLGKVLGNVELTLKGNTTVAGNVFGGGEMSGVQDNTTVKLQDNTHVTGNVYGGGDEGPVGGNSKVLIKDN